MSNYLKSLTLRFTPYRQTGESGLWNNEYKEYSMSGTYENPINFTIPDNENALYPETTYGISVIQALDAFDQDISSSVTPLQNSRRTTEDYPAVSRVFIGSLVEEDNQSKYYFNRPGYQKSYSNNANINVNDDFSTAKSQLNNDLLNSNLYTVKGLSDHENDPNFYKPGSLKGSGEWERADENDADFFNTYYGMSTITDTDTHYIHGNILHSNVPTLMPLDVFNKKIGIHEIDGKLDYPKTTTSAPITASYKFESLTDIDLLGNDYLVPDGILDQENGFIIRGDESANIKHFAENEETFGIFKIDHSDYSPELTNDCAVIGIKTKNWMTEDPEDAYGEIELDIKSKSKITNSLNRTVSVINIPFYTFAKPKLKLYQQLTENSSTYASVESTLIENTHRKTGITFANVNSSLYGAVKLEMSTHNDRPFLPLVNKNYDQSLSIYDSEIDSFVIYPSDNSFLDYIVNGTSILDRTKRQISFVLEVSYDENSDSKLMSFDSLSSAKTYNQDNWRVIGFSKSYDNDDSHYPQFLEEYALEPENIYCVYETGHDAKNLTEDSAQANNRKILCWPNGIFGLKLEDENGWNNLIPGKYYKFRATASNFVGTTSQVFIAKTEDPVERTYGSSIYLDGNVLAGYISPSASDQTCNINGLSVNSQIYIYGGENLQGQTHSTVITSDGETSGWQSNSANTKIEVKINNGQYAPLSDYGSRDLNHVVGTYTFGPSQATYYIKITSNSCKLANTAENEGNEIVNEYVITTTESNGLNVTTGIADQLSYNSFNLNGSYTMTGSHNITSTEFEYSKDDFVNVSTVSAVDNNKALSCTLTNLDSNTSYQYRAKVTSDDTTLGLNGVVYGQKLNFVTSDLPNVTVNVTPTRTTATIQVS